MINPLLKHHLLKHLPYELLRNPTSDGINTFIEKRCRKLLIISIVLFILAIVSLLTETKITLLSFIYPTILVLLSVGGFKQALQSKMTQVEIDKQLQEFFGHNNG